MPTNHPYDLVIGLDRSDRKADLLLITTSTGQRRSETIDTSPEALWERLLELRQSHPQVRVALCLEQPAVHLIAFLEAYEWITLPMCRGAHDDTKRPSEGARETRRLQPERDAAVRWRSAWLRRHGRCHLWSRAMLVTASNASATEMVKIPPLPASKA